MIIIAKILYLDQATAGDSIARKRETSLSEEEWNTIGATGKHAGRIVSEMQVLEFKVE